MREKLARAKLLEEVDHLTKEKEYAEKMEVLRSLEERERDLIDQLQNSHRKSLEADRRYALAY